MSLVVVLKGRIQWDKYQTEIELLNDRHGLRIKEISRKLSNGKTQINKYWYCSTRRSESQKKKKGENYVDKYLGPANKSIDELAPIRYPNELEPYKHQVYFQGDNMVLDKDLFKQIQKIAYGFFHDGDVEVIDLLNAERKIVQTI